MDIFFAKIQQEGACHKVRTVRVNPRQVLYIGPDRNGKIYITFQHSDDGDQVGTLGILSPDSIETVMQRLNRPYTINLCIRLAALLVATVAVVASIWISSCANPS